MAFRELGYSITDQVLSDDECDALIDSFSDSVAGRSRAGRRHLMNHPAVESLANDPRLLSLASTALQKPALPFTATLFDKSEDSNWLIPWHQDTALPLASSFDAQGWGPWSRKVGILYAHAPAWALSHVIALRVHLDASTGTNGPLRVIPRSHSCGVLSDDAVHELVSRSEPVECTVPRGGVLAMHPLLIHSSSKITTSSHRRVLHIDYADSLELASGIRLHVA